MNEDAKEIILGVVGVLVAAFLLVMAIVGIGYVTNDNVELDRTWSCTKTGIVELHHPKRSPTYERACTQWTRAPLEDIP